MPELDLDAVRHALRTARKRGYAEVEIESGDDRFAARLRPMAPGASPVAEPETEPPLLTVASPLVGFYRPASKPLEVGARVAVGDVVAVVTALGIPNDVESKVAGEVVEVLVEPNAPVEYGQPLARVRP